MEKEKYKEFKKNYINNMTKDDIFYFLQDMYKEDLHELLFGIDDSIFIEKVGTYNRDDDIVNLIDDLYKDVCYDYRYFIDDCEICISFDEYGEVVFINGFDKIIWSVDKKNEISKLVGKNILEVYKWLGVYCINKGYYEYFYNCVFLDFYGKILSKLNSDKKLKKIR